MGGWGGEELDQVRCELRNQVQEREVVQMTERVEECGKEEVRDGHVYVVWVKRGE